MSIHHKTGRKIYREYQNSRFSALKSLCNVDRAAFIISLSQIICVTRGRRKAIGISPFRFWQIRKGEFIDEISQIPSKSNCKRVIRHATKDLQQEICISCSTPKCCNGLEKTKEFLHMDID